MLRYTNKAKLFCRFIILALTGLCIVVVILGLFDQEYDKYTPKNGDLIFHVSTSRQSLAIQKATGSHYSHMGIVYLSAGSPFVYEAVGPVKSTPLTDWIGRGKDKHFVVKRLRDASDILTPDALKTMHEAGDKLKNIPYDICFNWSDEAIYCSELVWKIFYRALGLKVGELETLAYFDMSSQEVQKILSNRPECSLDPEEVVISPAAMFTSELLVTVYTERACPNP